MNGLVGQLVAGRKFPPLGVYRPVNGLMGTDEWFSRSTCGPPAAVALSTRLPLVDGLKGHQPLLMAIGSCPTGPPTQATGPPRSDAGVGIGMLRGNPLLSAI